MYEPQNEHEKKRIDQFWSQMDKSGGEDGCWLWTRSAGTNNQRYGEYYWHDKKVRTHRFAYMLVCGPIPEGLEVCHTCDNPPCCNPKHLFAGTHQQNMQDRSKKGRGSGSRGAKAGLRQPLPEVIELRP